MQSEQEMQLTLAHLRDAWGVDVSAAQSLRDEALWSWMLAAGAELIEREYEKAQGTTVSKFVNDPVQPHKKWWIKDSNPPSSHQSS